MTCFVKLSFFKMLQERHVFSDLPADLLPASMAAEPISFTYLRAAIGEYNFTKEGLIKEKWNVSNLCIGPGTSPALRRRWMPTQVNSGPLLADTWGIPRRYTGTCRRVPPGRIHQSSARGRHTNGTPSSERYPESESSQALFPTLLLYVIDKVRGGMFH